MIRKTDEKSFFPAQLKIQTRIPPGRPQTAAPVAGSWQGRDPGLRELKPIFAERARVSPDRGSEQLRRQPQRQGGDSATPSAGFTHLPSCLGVLPSRPPCGPGPLPRQALREGTVRLSPGRGGAPDILRAVTGSARAHELRSAWPRGHRARPLLAARLWLVLGPRLEEMLGRRHVHRRQCKCPRGNTRLY